MRAVRFTRFGGPEVLELVDVAEPHPGPGQIRIAVRAAGVNGIDWKLRQGAMPDGITFPAGTGVDAAGVVDEIGDGVTDVRVGDEVLGNGSGTYAEQAVLSTWAIKPAGLPFPEAAGYPTPIETATRMLDIAALEPGRTLVVSGAAGGVGSAVLHLARARGLRAIGTAGEQNLDYLRSLGAKATSYDAGWPERVRALAPDGVDAAFDIAGAGVLPDLAGLTGDPATVITIADFGGSVPGVVVTGQPQNQARAYVEALRLYEAGRFALPVDRTYPLAEAGDAQRDSEAGHVRGRIVLTVG